MFLEIVVVSWILLSYFKLTTINIKIFCRRQFLLIPHAELADTNEKKFILRKIFV